MTPRRRNSRGASLWLQEVVVTGGGRGRSRGCGGDGNVGAVAVAEFISPRKCKLSVL